MCERRSSTTPMLPSLRNGLRDAWLLPHNLEATRPEPRNLLRLDLTSMASAFTRARSPMHQW